MKLLICTPTYAPFVGGSRVFLQNMVQRLVAESHEATILTTNACRPGDFWKPPPPGGLVLALREELDGASVERLSITYPRPTPYVFGLMRRLGLWLHLSGLPSRLTAGIQQYAARWMPPLQGTSTALERMVPGVDLVHAEDSSWDGLFLSAARTANRLRKPLVVRPLMHLGDSWVRAHYQMAHQIQAYRYANVVLASSQREADVFKTMGVSSTRVQVIRMGLDPRSDDCASEENTPNALDERDTLSPVVAFIGANTYDKGAFALARAVAQLNLAGLHVEAVYVGPQADDLRAFLRNQPAAIQETARKRVRILGVVDDCRKNRLLSKCSVLALPSQVDTFGIVLLEAWSYGKPVIAAEAGGIPEVVRSEENGLLVPFGDESALASAIRRVLSEPALATRLGNAGRKSLQGYTWRRTYETLINAYTTALAGVE